MPEAAILDPPERKDSPERKDLQERNDSPQPKTRRVNLNLALKSYQDLEALAEKTDRTMTDIVRFGLALVKLYLDETAQGRKLIIANSNGKAISEIRFPD